MAKTLSGAGINDFNTILPGHITQSISAFTGTDAYNISISGSLAVTGSTNITGSLGITGFPNVSASLAASGVGNGFPFTGSAEITGSLQVIGTNIMSSSASPSITSILTDNDSYPYIQLGDATGPNFRMNLADEDSSGSAYMSFGRQDGAFSSTGFTANYSTGSNASHGEIVMTLGKNGLSGDVHDRFIVVSEPGPIATNTNSELIFQVGGTTFDRRVIQGTVQNGTNDYAEFAVGNQDSATGFKKHVIMAHGFNNTSSFAGFASSSLNTGSTARNFNANSIPFGIVAGGFSTAELGDTVFFVDRGGSLGRSFPITASFEITRGGSINMEGSITSSIVSASGHLAVNEIRSHTDSINNGFTLFASTADADSSFPIFQTRGDLDGVQNANIKIGDSAFADTGANLEISISSGQQRASFNAMEIAVSRSIEVKGGTPVTTHTTSPISSSDANAGRYHIVGGNLTCSIANFSGQVPHIGAEWTFFQTSSAGNFLFESGSGITVISKNDSMRLAQLGSSAVLKKVASTTFHLMGDLT